MSKKEFLHNFWQVFGFLKICFLQALGMYFIAYTFGAVAMAAGVRGCAPRPELLTWQLGLLIAVGFAATWASIFPIIFPRIWLQGFNKEVSFSLSGYSFHFFSTHPSYILIDLLFFVPAFIIFWNGQSETLCELNDTWGQGWGALFSAFLFPSLRLMFWYVLGKQIYARQFQSMFKGIGWWYAVAVPVMIAFSFNYVSSNILTRVKIPVVDAQSFVGGLDKHPEFEGQIVRVRGVLKRGTAKCGLWGKKDRTDYPYGTVVLDMGKNNGEIIVQAINAADVLDLGIEAQNKQGQTFEAFGYLSKLPNPEKKMICGIEKLPDDPPKGGRALLEIEMPK
jgi:hypothetical protein